MIITLPLRSAVTQAKLFENGKIENFDNQNSRALDSIRDQTIYNEYDIILSDVNNLSDQRSRRTDQYDKTAKIYDSILRESINNESTVARGFVDSPKAFLANDLLAAIKISEKIDRPLEKEMLASLQERLSRVSKVDDSENSSLTNIYESLVQAIDKADNEELTKYFVGVGVYQTLYQKITDIFSGFTNLIRADGDSKLKVDYITLKSQLQTLLVPYQSPPSKDCIIAGNFPTNGLTQSDANEICKKLGLNINNCVQMNNSDGTYYVMPDLVQVTKMIESIPLNATNDFVMTIPTYNVWKSTFDAQMSRLEEVVQATTQKLSNAYSRFESTNKTISSIMQSLADMLHVFLRNLV